MDRHDLSNLEIGLKSIDAQLYEIRLGGTIMFFIFIVMFVIALIHFW